MENCGEEIMEGDMAVCDAKKFQEVPFPTSFVCKSGISLGEEEWICSSELKCVSTFDQNELSRIRAAFKQTRDGLKIDKSDYLCELCISTFGRRQKKGCKHPMHVSSKRPGPASLSLTYITASTYFSTYKKQNLLPNDGICKNRACNPVDDNDDNCTGSDEPPSKKKMLSTLNDIRTVMSPKLEPVLFKKHNISAQTNVVNRAITEVTSVLSQGFKSSGLNVQNQENLADLQQKAADFDWIMNSLKEKMQSSTPTERKIILTLVPPSWTISKTRAFFGVSKRLVQCSRKRREKTGTVLPPAEPKIGRKLPEETKKLVQDFYYQDKVSRATPGENDKVSVKNHTTGKREHKQRRYLLCNLSELYSLFKEENPLIKIGKTSFMQLRPKECLSFASKGYHNVCLCVYHQNVKLLFNALKLPSIKKYLEAMVCSTDQKDCNFRRCLACSSNKEIVEKMIEEDSPVLKENPRRQFISYHRWITSDGTQFINEEKSTEDFLEFVLNELELLVEHHFIATQQQLNLDRLKAELKNDEVIVQCDFAENYSPGIQDAIQSDYWTHSYRQITLHTFTAYWKQTDQLSNSGFVVISDCTVHDTNTFFAFQSKFLAELKSKLMESNITIRHIVYYTDGCAGQYKNRKNFINLFHHSEDFGISAEWNFFATAHGKGPCDALGGTTKRLVRTASLQGTKLTTAEEFYTWCKINIKKVNYILMTDEEVQQAVSDSNLLKRYEDICTIAGTRQAHRVAVEADRINLFKVSTDVLPMTSRAIKTYIPAIPMEEFSIHDWIGCIYEDKWYLAKVEKLDLSHQELLVSFWKMNAGEKGGTSFVPEKSRSCFVPIANVLKKISPSTSSRSQRFVIVSLEEQNTMDALLKTFLNRN